MMRASRAVLRILLRERCARVRVAGRWITAERLAAYRLAQGCPDLAAGEVITVTRRGRVAGVLVARPLAWDTAIFQRRMGALRWVMASRRVAEATAVYDELLRRADDWRRRHRIEHLAVRIAMEDWLLAHRLEATGFQLADVVLTWQCTSAPSAPQLPAGCALRRAVSSDVPVLERIARQAFTVNRFRHDPTLPSDAVDRLYARWITEACQGKADAVWVMVSRQTPVGFATCVRERLSAAPLALASVDLVGVHPRYQGRGIGTALVRAATRWGLREACVVELRTQVMNAAGMATYQRAGFAPAPVGLMAPGGVTLHRSWLPERS